MEAMSIFKSHIFYNGVSKEKGDIGQGTKKIFSQCLTARGIQQRRTYIYIQRGKKRSSV
jgi:hypothetical protein